MSKSDYEWYKSKGICPRCRVNDAFINHVLCTKCLEETSINNTKYSHKRAEYQKRQNEVKKIRYMERKKEGMCTACGKKKAQHGIYCNECWRKRIKNERKRNMKKLGGRTYGDAFKERIEAGLCAYCGKEQEPGYKLCESCLKKSRSKLSS